MKIFVSYARKDLPRVQPIVTRLFNVGHEVWFDQRLNSLQWKEQLRDQIQDSECFVYVLTPASVTSEWCWWEFAWAIHTGTKIVTVRLEACDLDGLLAEHHYIDVTQDSPEASRRNFLSYTIGR